MGLIRIAIYFTTYVKDLSGRSGRVGKADGFEFDLPLDGFDHASFIDHLRLTTHVLEDLARRADGLHESGEDIPEHLQASGDRSGRAHVEVLAQLHLIQ